MDPAFRETVHPNRWKQIVREGDAAPAWLAEDFGADPGAPRFSPISRNGAPRAADPIHAPGRGQQDASITKALNDGFADG